MMVLFVAATLAATPAAPAKPLAQAAKIMDGSLKDFPSARLRGVQLSKDGLHVCGQVNAKNSYGAYGGWMLFDVDLSEGTLETRDPTEAVPGADAKGLNALFNLTCGGSGADVTPALVNFQRPG